MAGADELAERFHKMLPPNLQDDQQNPIPPQAQAAVAHAQQQVGLLQGELQKLNFEKQAKQWEVQGKLQQINLQHSADMQLEDKKLAVQVAVAEVNTKAQNEQERQLFIQDIAKEVLKQHGTSLAQGHSQAHEHAMQKDEQGHARQMQVDKAVQSANLADQQAQNANSQSEQDAQQSASAQSAAQQQPEQV
jgi:hypothetical protein